MSVITSSVEKESLLCLCVIEAIAKTPTELVLTHSGTKTQALQVFGKPVDFQVIPLLPSTFHLSK